MKWFKHDSDASNDAKLRKLRIKYGAQGYGVYWYCLELIARNVEKHNLTFELEHDAELIADDFKLSGELVQDMMTYMVNLGLFENTQGVITCLKMSTRTDEYTQKLILKLKNSTDSVPTISDESPTKSELKEEKRREQNRLAWESLSDSERLKITTESCVALRTSGVADVSPINPSFIKLLELGVRSEEFKEAALMSKVKKFNYIVEVISSNRLKAENLTINPKVDPEKEKLLKGML
jgi:hypothetical protein